MPVRGPSPERLEEFARAGRRRREHAIENAARRYSRDRDLPKLLASANGDYSNLSSGVRRRLILDLVQLARNDVRASQEGRWCYDRNRHIAVLGALRAEMAARHRIARIERSPAH